MRGLDIERDGGPMSGKRRGAAASPSADRLPFYDGPDSSAGRKRTAWIVQAIVAVNVVVFVVVMFVNDCPRRYNPYGSCVAKSLHRISFQPLRQNPLLGPSSST